MKPKPVRFYTEWRYATRYYYCAECKALLSGASADWPLYEPTIIVDVRQHGMGTHGATHDSQVEYIDIHTGEVISCTVAHTPTY